MMLSESDRRQHVRVNFQAPATVQGMNGKGLGLCLNFSEGGMLFLGPEVLPIGMMTSFAVDFPPLGEVEVIGEVRRHMETSEGTALGIRFVRVTTEHLGVIQQLVMAGEGSIDGKGSTSVTVKTR